MNTPTRRRGIAVVGIGCWFPGGRGCESSGRTLGAAATVPTCPRSLASLTEYHDPDPTAPDKTYGRRAAVIDGFAFDWAGNRIPKETYESTDVVQWLALEVARHALVDAGYDHDSSPRADRRYRRQHAYRRAHPRQHDATPLALRAAGRSRRGGPTEAAGPGPRRA